MERIDSFVRISDPRFEMSGTCKFGRAGMPVARAGATVGLLGGSFDPPHMGHVHITYQALKRFGLDQVWWLVTPGNPLKSNGPAALSRRVAAARNMLSHPKVVVTDYEQRKGTRYTAETLKSLKSDYPSVNFVWLMGADNLASFHLWNQWRWIMGNTPIGILARPGDRTAARNSKVAKIFESNRLSGKKSMILARSKPPCWCFINVPMLDLSSTAIRARGDWPD